MPNIDSGLYGKQRGSTVDIFNVILVPNSYTQTCTLHQTFLRNLPLKTKPKYVEFGYSLCWKLSVNDFHKINYFLKGIIHPKNYN